MTPTHTTIAGAVADERVPRRSARVFRPTHVQNGTLRASLKHSVKNNGVCHHGRCVDGHTQGRCQTREPGAFGDGCNRNMHAVYVCPQQLCPCFLLLGWLPVILRGKVHGRRLLCILVRKPFRAFITSEHGPLRPPRPQHLQHERRASLV